MQEAASNEIAPANEQKPDQSAVVPERADAPGSEYWLP
jgi:hypothetical protein